MRLSGPIPFLPAVAICDRIMQVVTEAVKDHMRFVESYFGAFRVKVLDGDVKLALPCAFRIWGGVLFWF